jgi:type I restriction enzyme S subunit
MRGWRSTKWGELATLEYGKALRGYQNQQEGFPVFGTNGKIGYHNEVLCRHAGLIIGRKGAYRGVHYSAVPFWVIDTGFYLEPKNPSLDLRWAYYQLRNFDINHLDSGSAIPSTSREAFYEIPVEVPPPDVQKKVAGILSAYDDLIENNTRRITILEKMAKVVYQEWFEHFRFPGHTQSDLVTSEIGLIPQGWSIKRLCEFGRVVTGKTPSTEKPEFFGGSVPFIKTPDMHGNTFCIASADTLSDLGAASQKSKTVPVNSIIVNCIGALAGSVSITTTSCQTNQQINSVVLRDQRDREFLYVSLTRLREGLRQIGSNGATMINVNKSKFELLPVRTPPTDQIQIFHEQAFPIFEEIRNLQARNINLYQTRDLLLPKLISGEVDVEHLEVEAVAQLV